MNSKIKTPKSIQTAGDQTALTKLTWDIPGNKVTPDKKIFSSMFEIFGRVQGTF